MVIERQKFFLSSNEKGMSKTELGKLERVGQIISVSSASSNLEWFMIRLILLRSMWHEI